VDIARVAVEIDERGHNNIEGKVTVLISVYIRLSIIRYVLIQIATSLLIYLYIV